MISPGAQLLRFVLFIAAAAAVGAYLLGRHDGRSLCEAGHATAQVAAEQGTKAEARKDIARATRTGKAREADRAALDTLFNRLAEEARHDTPAPADAAACELPAERLRRWADANAGIANPGAATAQPAGPAAAPAAAGLGQDAGPGGQPPAGGAGLPPAGQPALRAVGPPGA